MSGITLAQAQAQLDAWLAASTAVATGQEYRIGDRMLKRADSADIRSQIKYWQSQVERLANGGGGGIRLRGITPG